MAVVKYDSKSSTTDRSGTFSWSHTVGNYNNRILVVSIGFRDGSGGRVVSSVTYNGDAMTKAVGDSSGGYYSSIYYILNPDVGTHNITVTCSVSSDACISCGAVSFYNVLQLAPITGSNSGYGTAISVSVAGKRSGYAMVDSVFAWDNSDGQTPAYSQIYEYNWDDGENFGTYASYRTGCIGTSSLTWTGTGNTNWRSYGVGIYPTTSGGGFLINFI